MPLGNPFVVVVSRSDVERCDTAPTLAVLARLLESVDVARDNEQQVEIAFHGYDAHRSELFEIPEVRNFVHQLDEKFPFWLFFLTKEGTGLHALAWCYLPPYLTPEAQKSIWPQRLMELLERRWVPALGTLCTQLGMSDDDIQSRIAAAAHYFVEGPRLPFDPSTT